MKHQNWYNVFADSVEFLKNGKPVKKEAFVEEKLSEAKAKRLKKDKN